MWQPGFKNVGRSEQCRQQEKDHGSADLAPLSSSPLATPSLYRFRSRPRAGPGQASRWGHSCLMAHSDVEAKELVRTVTRLRLAFQSAPQRVAWRSSLLRMPEVQLSWSRTTDRSGDRQPSIPPWKRDDTSEDMFGVIADRRRIFEWAPDPGGDGHTYRVGHPVVDDFLHFAGARARPNTVRACAHDLKVLFSFVAKELAEVAAADVRALVSAQRRARHAARTSCASPTALPGCGRPPSSAGCPRSLASTATSSSAATWSRTPSPGTADAPEPPGAAWDSAGAETRTGEVHNVDDLTWMSRWPCTVPTSTSTTSPPPSSWTRPCRVRIDPPQVTGPSCRLKLVP